MLDTIVRDDEDLPSYRVDCARTVATIAIVESRPFFRECIRRSLQPSLGVSVATYSKLSDLRERSRGVRFDLVVLSLMDANGEACAKALKEVSELAAGCAVVALGAHDDADLARAAIRHGAKGYVPVTMGFELAVEAIRFVLAGGTYVPTDYFLAANPLSVPALPPPPRGRSLTDREQGIVRAIQEGKSNKVIARDLNISISTAKVHVRNVMKKLNARNRTEVAMKA